MAKARPQVAPFVFSGTRVWDGAKMKLAKMKQAATGAPFLARFVREKWGFPQPAAFHIREKKNEFCELITASLRSFIYALRMPWSLKRYYETNALHFITWSCYCRKPLLTPDRRDLLLTVFEQMRIRYRFVVVGYVIMPEHLHLLISEPEEANPSTVVQAMKLSFVRRLAKDGCPISRAVDAGEVGILSRRQANHFWMSRFYDFNVWSESKISEKLHYMHQNPVTRELVKRPEDWKWSSFCSYACGETGVVHVNDWSIWEQRVRSKAV